MSFPLLFDELAGHARRSYFVMARVACFCSVVILVSTTKHSEV